MWGLRFAKRADKQRSKVGPDVRRIIIARMLKYIVGCENPRARGKGLAANGSGEWSYRFGDCRAFREIGDDELVALTLEVGHRGDVCR